MKNRVYEINMKDEIKYKQSKSATHFLVLFRSIYSSKETKTHSFCTCGKGRFLLVTSAVSGDTRCAGCPRGDGEPHPWWS